MVDFRFEPFELREDPAIFQRVRLPIERVRALHAAVAQLHQHIAGTVPEFVGEVPGGGHALVLVALVRAHRRPGEHREAEGIGPVLRCRDQRIDHVAARLRHLFVVRVADKPVEEHRAKGRLVLGAAVSHVVEGEHDHPGAPEEHDVVAHLHVGGRIEVAEIVRVVRPAQVGVGGQARREPRVEHVFVLVK